MPWKAAQTSGYSKEERAEGREGGRGRSSLPVGTGAHTRGHLLHRDPWDQVPQCQALRLTPLQPALSPRRKPVRREMRKAPVRRHT